MKDPKRKSGGCPKGRIRKGNKCINPNKKKINKFGCPKGRIRMGTQCVRDPKKKVD